MRIAHVITRMIIGGAQENTLLCCRELMRTYGDDVLLLTGPETGLEGSLLESVRASGIPMQILPALRRSVNPWHDVLGYFELKSALRNFAPDVVHTHSAKGGVLGRLAASNLRVPVIIHTVHGAPYHHYQGRIARTLSRWCETYAAQRCHALVSVADAMTDQLVQGGVALREKFTTIYSGMDVDTYLDAGQHRQETRRRLGYKTEHVVVGKVARLFHLKGHQYVIEAAKKIIAQQPNLRFLFVGDGVLRPELKEQVKQAGLEQHFKFLGLVEPGEVPALLSAMDIVLHTSLREGLARVLPQALLVGRAVISYDVDGAREVVLHGHTGYLIPPQSIEGLENTILVLANNENLRETLAKQGRKLCQDRFRYELMTKQLRQLYEKLRNNQSNNS